MDWFDTDNPDIPRLKSYGELEYESKHEKCQITVTPPSDEPVKPLFNFDLFKRRQTNSYKPSDGVSANRTKNEPKVAPQKRERKLSSDDQNLDQKGKPGMVRENTFASSPPPSPLQLSQRSSSYANIHEMKKALPDDVDQRNRYLKELNKELRGREQFAYDDESIGSMECISMGRRNNSFAPLIEDQLVNPETVTHISEFELAPMHTLRRSDSITSTSSGYFTPGTSSVEPSPAPTPKSSPKLPRRHEGSEETTDCVKFEIQPEKKKLFGIGPVYQPPSEQVCVRKEEARQMKLKLLRRIVHEGFSATSKTRFQPREDGPLSTNTQDNETVLDSAKSLKDRFISRSEVNFLSPTSM